MLPLGASDPSPRPSAISQPSDAPSSQPSDAASPSPSDAPSSQPSVGLNNRMRQAHIHVPARSHRMCEPHSHLLGQVLSCQPSDAPSSSHRMRQFLNHRGAAIGCAKLTSMYQLTSNVLSSQPSVGPSSVADQLHFLIAGDLHFLVADDLHHTPPCFLRCTAHH